VLELNLPADADSARVLDRLDYLCRTIDPADLAEGESVDPRLQLLPSLGHADPEGVAALLGGLPPVGLVLGAVRSYRGPDGDTLAVPVESDGLFRIHKHLARHLPGSAEGDYDPRIVLCKVRRGRGAAYDGDDALEGAALTVSEATLPGPGGPRTVRLDGPDPAAARVAKKYTPPRPQAPAPVARPAPAPVAAKAANGLTFESSVLARTPAREPVTLQAAWKSLTPVARDDLRRLRDRGTDGAMRKAFRLVGQAARDGESRGLLLDWLAKKWLHSPTQRSQNRYVLDSDPQKVRYFKTPPKGAQGPGQGDQPGGGKQDAQQEAPAAPAQQQGQEEQPAPQQEKPAAKPAKAPAKGKTPRTDPAQAQQELGAMLADPSTADAGRARDILLGLTVAQARQVAEKLGVDLTGARSGGKADVAQKLASRLASKALEGSLASHEGSVINLDDYAPPREAQPAPAQAAPQQAPEPAPEPAEGQDEDGQEEDPGAFDRATSAAHHAPAARSDESAPDPKEAATAERLAVRAALESPVVEVADLRAKMPPSMRGKAFDEMILRLADEGKLIVAQDANPQQFSDEEKKQFIWDGASMITMFMPADDLKDPGDGAPGEGQAPQAAPAPQRAAPETQATAPEADAGEPDAEAVAEGERGVHEALTSSPVADLSKLRAKMPPSMRGQAFNDMIIRMIDEGKLIPAQDVNISQFTPEEQRQFVKDGPSMFTTVMATDEFIPPPPRPDRAPAPAPQQAAPQQQQAPAQQAAPASATSPARAPQKAPAPRRAARPGSGDPLGGRAPATRKPSSQRNVDASGGDATYDPAEMGDDGEVAAEFLAGERARANGGEAGKQMDLRQGARIADAPGSANIDRIRQSASTLRDITGGKVGRDGAAKFLAEVERSNDKGGLLTAAKSAGVKANQSMSLPALKRAIQSHVAASLAEHHPPERPARRSPGEWRRLAAARQQALGNIDPARRRALDVADEGDEPAPRPAPAPSRAPSREDRVAALERREREREAGQPRAKRRGATKE
jgi:hypothetical protein